MSTAANEAAVGAVAREFAREYVQRYMDKTRVTIDYVANEMLTPSDVDEVSFIASLCLELDETLRPNQLAMMAATAVYDAAKAKLRV